VATEIERKFLVRDDSWRAQAGAGKPYRQGYLESGTAASVRVRVAGDRGSLNIKGATLSVTRTEYEYEIPVQDAEEMLATLCVRPIIAKRRHFVDFAGHTWEIDVFEGENEGLIIAEIELERADEPFERPPWVGEEVSDDPRYYNVSLVRHPYKDWSA
jgi:adenylate cyclase